MVYSGEPPSTKAPSTQLSSEMKMLAQNAVQNPSTLKPLTSRATSNSISALMTSRNSPKETSVSGKVSTTSKGRTTALASPSSSAAITSAAVLPNRRPLNRWLATHSDSAVMAQCSRNGGRLSNMGMVRSQKKVRYAEYG